MVFLLLVMVGTASGFPWAHGKGEIAVQRVRPKSAFGYWLGQAPALSILRCLGRSDYYAPRFETRKSYAPITSLVSLKL
jgi:hypothetical protein